MALNTSTKHPWHSLTLTHSGPFLCALAQIIFIFPQNILFRPKHSSLVAKVPDWHVLVCVSAAGFHIQFSACGFGKQSRMAQGLAILNLHGDPEIIPGSWLWIASVLAIAAA